MTEAHEQDQPLGLASTAELGLVERLRQRAGQYDEYDWHGELELEAADEIERLRACVLELEAQCEAGAGSETRWLEWLTQHGMLHYYSHCRRPDGSNGPAWVLRTPYMTNGDSCEAWHATSAAGALRKFLGA